VSMNKYEAGMLGQQAAESFLVGMNCEILARNYRTRTGEIDIIVRDGDYIVFVEVKYRSGLGYGAPSESVGTAKQKKITRTAMHYIAVNKLDNHDFRFDVIEAVQNNGQVHINHIENAFGA